MGKAILIILLGAGIILARQAMSANETGSRTAQVQASYEEQVLAREIARSAFNTAMNEARGHGANVFAAIAAINGSAGARTGEMRGGRYRVRAIPQSGHGLTLVSEGFFGGAEHTMTDKYTVPVLYARCNGRLRVKFIESQAGYCSAVYMQRYPRNGPMPAPEMLFPAGNNRNNLELAVEKLIHSGTRMDFFIGVDKNCSTRPSNPSTYDVSRHTYRASDYDHIHRGLQPLDPANAFFEETVWSFIEQHPADFHRWRIGFEDQHITSWDNPTSESPRNSLQATKRYGYDGNGWPTANAMGYRQLRDYGDRPDFSDQVIEVTLTPVAGGNGALTCEGDFEPLPPTEPPPSGPSPSDPDPEPTPTPTPSPEPTPTTTPCACPSGNGNNNKKVAVMHFPRGNPANAHIICIARDGLNGHIPDDPGDYIVCEGD